MDRDELGIAAGDRHRAWRHRRERSIRADGVLGHGAELRPTQRIVKGDRIGVLARGMHRDVAGPVVLCDGGRGHGRERSVRADGVLGDAAIGGGRGTSLVDHVEVLSRWVDRQAVGAELTGNRGWRQGCERPIRADGQLRDRGTALIHRVDKAHGHAGRVRRGTAAVLT